MRETFTRQEVKELICAYEDLLGEVGQTYYNQDQDEIDKSVKVLNQVLDSMGFEELRHGGA